jgi:hypothetical protein
VLVSGDRLASSTSIRESSYPLETTTTRLLG